MISAIVVTGIPALLIILALLAVFILGIVSLVKLTARGARRVSGARERDVDAAE